MYHGILDQYLGMKTEIIPNGFWDEISTFQDIIISISGGVDSTAVAVAFYNKGLKFSLFWNNTLRSMKTARKTIVDLVKFTESRLFFSIPFHEQNLITKKTKRKVAQIVRGEVKYAKKSLPCCYYLKEFPVIQFAKTQTDINTLFISSIAGYEAMQRQIRLGELRNKNTYLRFKKRESRWFAYPLRDYTNRKNRALLQNYLSYNGFNDVKASSCHTCPVLYLFEDYIIKQEENKSRIERSKKVYAVT